MNVPIVLFVYKRLDTLRLLIDALKLNYLSKHSDLIIYSDFCKDHQDVDEVNSVRVFIKEITGFKSIRIIQSTLNLGLANSVISGVTEVLNEYNSCIVLEDDLIISHNFLSFMNSALQKYEHNSEVFSISGYCFGFSQNFESEFDGYFLNRPNSWGWGTWSDRWRKIDWKLPELDSGEMDKLSSLGSDVKKMYRDQQLSNIDSWHIRFIYNQFKFSGLTFYPTVSKVNNIGFDSFATHTKFGRRRFSTKLDLQNNTCFKFPEKIVIHPIMQKALIFKLGKFSRGINKILALLGLD